MRRNSDPSPLRSRSLALALSLIVLPGIAAGDSSADADRDSQSTADDSKGRGSWAAIPTIIGTPPLHSTKMTYSSAIDKMVVFGASGADDTITYQLNGSTFRNAPTYLAPAPRAGHGFVTDESTGRLVLFGGGGYGPNLHSDTWTFDPALGTWENKTPDKTPAGSPEGRYFHAMSYAGAGRVLLFSGATGPQQAGNADTWVYDVAKNLWLQLSPPLSPRTRAYAAMAWLGGDRVLLFGGASADAPYQDWLSDAWVFDLSRKEWKEVTSANGPVQVTLPQLLYDPISSRIVILGSPNSYPAYLDVWTVSLDALRWVRSSSASGQLAFQAISAGISRDGTVVVGGPSPSNPSYQSQVWHLDPTTMTWEEMPTEPSPASCSWTTSVGFHRERASAYMISFCDDGQPRMFEYSREGRTWIPLASNPPIVWSYSPPMSAALEDGMLVYTGGPEHESWRFSTASGRWQRSRANVGPETYYGAVLAEAGKGKVLMFGGYDSTGTMSDQSWVYDLVSDSWSEATSTPHPTPRSWPGATYDDRSGRVIMFGGFQFTPQSLHVLGDTWAFDLESRTWANLSSATAPSPRFVPTLAQMGPGGPVLLFGGLDETQNALGGTWHFDGISWKLTDPVQSARPRGFGRPVWDPETKKLLMYGGFAGGGWSTETWEYSLRTPVVLATTPSKGASGVAREAAIEVEFDMPMQFTKMLDEVRSVPEMSAATGAGTGTKFRIDHSEPLKPDTEYRVSISPRVVSTDGIPMGEWYNFTFRTAVGTTITTTDVLRALPWALAVAGVALITGAVIWRWRRGNSIRAAAREARPTAPQAMRAIQGRQIGGAAALARKRAAVRTVAERARLRSRR